MRKPVRWIRMEVAACLFLSATAAWAVPEPALAPVPGLPRPLLIQRSEEGFSLFQREARRAPPADPARPKQPDPFRESAAAARYLQTQS
ncbi:MAG: hypothetical protein COV76_06570 [Candidatus Omnitrophica bacterium CG11_big_fil_rev_8_21_14_0_20_64_10]|nr:MAG: hypothetical protein COV76_06570 [Candidatus Omnitrophica bacterium CG11_big_fil_rev_8_21_14_0_20_64_10]